MHRNQVKFILYLNAMLSWLKKKIMSFTILSLFPFTYEKMDKLFFPFSSCNFQLSFG